MTTRPLPPRRTTTATYAESDSDDFPAAAPARGDSRRSSKRAKKNDETYVDDDSEDAEEVDYCAIEDVGDAAPKHVYANANCDARDAFLWTHRGVFEALLPRDGHVTHFTHLAAKYGAGGDVEIVPKVPIETPKMITATLKPYQQKGLEFLAWLVNNGMNGILGDEMGLGKTLQTLSMLSYMKESGRGGPYLVVCPLSVLSSWEAELKRWTPTMKFIRFHGPMNERASIKKRCTREKFDVYLTTYEQLVAEVGWFRVSRGWRCVVLDEGHKIKNDKANLSGAVYSIPSQYRFILTGTPLQNNLQELWALLHYLYPQVFTSQTAKYFGDSFNLQKGTYNTDGIESSRKLLDLIMLRRLKSHVDLSIPPKEELIIYLPLTPMQRFWYKRLLTRIDNGTLDQIFTAPLHNADNDTSSNINTPPELPNASSSDSLFDPNGSTETLNSNGNSGFETTNEILQYAQQNQKGDWAKLMNLLLQLRKVCNHPYILPNSEPEPYINGEHLVLASSKLIFLDKFLPKLFAEGHRVLIFSQFTRMLDILEDFMRLREIAYARLDGRTSRPRRNLDIRLFQRQDSPYNVFLISTKAGGLGINLTTADTVIMIDSDWNPQNDLQAMARSHRIGQTKNVKVYRTICRDTVEEQMLTRLQKKLFLSLKVTAGGRQNEDDAMPTLSKDDLLTIFRYGTKTIANDGEDDPDAFLNKTAEEILQASQDHAKQLLELVSDNVEAPTEFELKGFETVKSRFFEGKEHIVARKFSKNNSDIANEWNQMEKRVRVQRTVQVGENMVLKELEGCEQWEAAPLMTSAETKRLKPRGGGQDVPVVVPAKRVKKKFDHQEICIVCDEPGHIVLCSGCPRVVHPKCVGTTMKAMESVVLYFCPQHECCICARKTQNAGGLLFRCGTCANAYCEDCLPVDEDLVEIGESLPVFEALDYGAINQAYYIKCPSCCKYEAAVKAELAERDAAAGVAAGVGGEPLQEGNQRQEDDEMASAEDVPVEQPSQTGAEVNKLEVDETSGNGAEKAPDAEMVESTMTESQGAADLKKEDEPTGTTAAAISAVDIVDGFLAGTDPKTALDGVEEQMFAS
ncbi:P-loop containing nucleoside triphosphate hydrolase protein [Obelidium mucronatum]|nr:P-loop containing nucleoside triphosphate hydrolase protein [Obelidium mucronatum]